MHRFPEPELSIPEIELQTDIMSSATVPPDIYTPEMVEAANDVAMGGWDMVDSIRDMRESLA